MKLFKKIQFNAPVVIIFSLICLAALLINMLTNGLANTYVFSVYRSSLLDPLTYPRFFLHVLGHSGWSHFINNIVLLLAVGPSVESRIGSKHLIWCIVITAFISGLAQFIFFPGTALLGASGIVFMLIIMCSMGGADSGRIPLTLIFVFIFYVGGQIIEGLTVQDNVSQFAHIIGGVCGAVLGIIIGSRKR